MQSALICVTSIHRIHHVSHFLPGVPHSIFAFFSKFAAKVNTRDLRLEPEGELTPATSNSSKLVVKVIDINLETLRVYHNSSN